jgi:hypothetical protein
MQKNGRLMMPPVMTAAQLCTAVFDGDMPLLRRLLHAGANANAGDYDKRTALHIAAADGNLPAVSCTHVPLLRLPSTANAMSICCRVGAWMQSRLFPGCSAVPLST